MMFFLSKKSSYQLLVLLLVGISCTNCSEQENFLFRQIPTSESGIDFSNDITESEDFNILNFHYIYNGGGVGVGDFNKDGLPDLIFTGNQVASKLYLNQGNLTFGDITEKSNFETKGWATGVSIVDINADGWDDIYISVGGLECDGNCKNQLFIHRGLDENGIPTFEEKAEAYGLADGLYTQQAVFFDYDTDGDLDAYLLHNVIDKRDKNIPSNKKFISEKSIDQLLENDGNGHFTDVSESKGIINRGYGLGVVINDFNNDNLPDIYIANDFLSDDLMYLNKGIEAGEHQGFKEVSKAKLKHTSYNAMGVDVADVNGDALPDVMVLDMLPDYNERQKTMLGFMNYNKFQLALRQGYSPQYIRNTLQVHNGFLDNELLPFSEVGYLAGVSNTDWSWTPLLADFDNDGDRDLFVTNGYGKDITDLDFINYSQQRSPFGTKESQQRELYEAVQKMKPITMPNYIFENQGNLAFQNQQNNWIKKENSISNGAVYTDLDNDGDLDLVVNNIDAPAFVMENRSETEIQNNYIKIQLKGTPKNPMGIGTKVEIWTEGKVQTHYQSPVRGYLSTVENICHFGLGKYELIDSIKLIWLNGQVQVLENIEVNQLLQIIRDTTKNSIVIAQNRTALIFEQNKNLFSYNHTENPYLDFDAQPLLMFQHSRQGPCMTTANIDGKTGEELFVGGAKGVPAQIFYQNTDGSYRVKTLDAVEQEDIDAQFFDIDGDDDLDLYVVSGGTEFLEGKGLYRDRIYINGGNGNFELQTGFNLPENSGGCVVSMDFDKKGGMNWFVGGRVTPRQYPKIPTSHLLAWKDGKVIDITPKSLSKVGMVTDAVWSDYDKDGWQDLIVVGEWMPITIFKNENGKLSDEPIEIPNSRGLWNCIKKADLDKDGDEDYILGNLGLNSRLQAADNQPLVLYIKDFDGNGTIDPLIGQYFKNEAGSYKNYPIHARDDVMKQVVSLKNRYITYADFGKVTFSDLLQSELSSDDFLKADYLQSAILWNEEDMSLEALPLPIQFAPIQDILVEDVNKDGHLDLLFSGNDYNAERNNGRYDAFNGLLLKGNSTKKFQSILTAESGFYVPFDGRDIVKMRDNKGQDRIIVGQNSGEFCVFEY